MRIEYLIAAVILFVGVLSQAPQAEAQGYGRSTFGQTRAPGNLNVPSFGSFENQRQSFNNNPSTPGNLPPRQDLLQRPTVNPFLRLLNSPTPTSDYFTIVRPEMEFRRFANQQAQEQARELQRLNQNAALMDFQQQELMQQQQQMLELQGQGQRSAPARSPGRGTAAHPATGAAQGLRPTGHGTTFGNSFGYFPGLP